MVKERYGYDIMIYLARNCLINWYDYDKNNSGIERYTNKVDLFL